MTHSKHNPDALPFVEFIENKVVSAHRIEQLLGPAIQENRHTNFGPVSHELEALLHGLNGANPGQAACCVANASIGLQAAVSAFENHLGQPLRWAVSDFSFFTGFMGPFRNHIPVPCRGDGMLSIANLKRCSLDSYDAVLATNVFGLWEDFSSVFQFCREHKKVLLVDNAAGFRALAPFHQAAREQDDLLWAEVVSFHQTKPWGMGEGGAVFLPRKLAETFRAAINFGTGFGRRLDDLRWCTNGKMSEIAAAQILARAKDHENWAPTYRQQAERLLSLGKQVGLQPLTEGLPERSVPGQVAFLCDRAVALEDLTNSYFRILKYYLPVPTSGAGARSLFARIVNVPCHSEMSGLSDDIITGVLQSVAAG